MCSTPFGITEFRGLPLLISHPDLGVLNAFRHHRVSRIRSSARGKLNPLVLNAFRHHRVSRDARHRMGFPRLHVLNAFRHHRVSRVREIGEHHNIKSCSTPFGITEFRGPGLFDLHGGVQRAQRLSASQSFAG